MAKLIWYPMQDRAISDVGTEQNLIVFDGECVLCSRFFRFMLWADTKKRFKFVIAQSPIGQSLYRQLGLPTYEFETNLVIVDGVVHQRLDAFAAAMRSLPALWPVLSACRFLPRFLKDPLYHFIARHRFAFFGRFETCLVPDSSMKARFFPGGYA
ncbi:thiol-disulfide oxidoreductase DCC family protein [Ruegeria faecimaris]|uniref:thiol-disulfide oxidoreductase DCC family protein n=1 Tax=Ruegeria faecimaris TaxID=686389 RepID=UPI002FE4977A